MPETSVARSELILGASPGGRTVRAETLADAWLAASAQHRAVYIDTAQSWDEEMSALIGRHRAPSQQRRATVEEPTELAHALGVHSRPDTLIVVDCLSFWLTASLMQALVPQGARPGTVLRMHEAVHACAGPLVLLGNRLAAAAGPQQRDLATLAETLGTLEQQAVNACERVTLMSAGMVMTLKGRA